MLKGLWLQEHDNMSFFLINNKLINWEITVW